MPRRSFFFALLLLTACDPPLSEVKAQNKALIETTQKRFEAVRRLLAGAEPKADPSCKPPTPLHPAFDEGHDVEVISYGDIERAGADRDSYGQWTEIPTYSDSTLHSVLQDSHPTMAKYRLDTAKVTSSWRASYAQAATVKYLVVLKTRAMDREAGTATVDAFLLEYSDAPKILCSLTQDLSVGAHLGTSDYQVIERNRKTGKEKVVRSDSHDNFQNAMYGARALLDSKLKAQWGIGIDQKRGH